MLRSPSHFPFRSSPGFFPVTSPDAFSGPFPGTIIAAVRIIASANIASFLHEFRWADGECTAPARRGLGGFENLAPWRFWLLIHPNCRFSRTGELAP